MSTTKLKSVDVVVVGSGVVGSIMSMELASAGLSVVCLERGKQFDIDTDFQKPNVYDELKFDRHSDIFQNLARDTITFRNNNAQTALPMREMGAFKPGEMVGGTAAHWGGNARRFLPHDFEIRSRIKERYGKSFIPEDCNLQDWGVTWDDIEPYYDQFEEIFGVGGKAGNLNGEIQAGGNPYEGPRSREYPNPPTRRTHEGALFADAVSSLGYVPFQGPTAAMTQDYRNLYRVQMLECARGGFCSSHVCAQGAKANPLSAVLPALARQPTFELRPLCNVLRVNMDSTGKKATGVTYIDPRGNEIEQPASIVVLGAYCFSNVRLLLLSGIGTPYDPLTGKGVVGRNYSYQQGGSVQVFFDDREFNPFIGGGQVNTSIDEFNGDLIDRGPLGFIGGAYMKTSTSGATPIKGKRGAARHAALGGRMEESRSPLLPPKHVDLDSRILSELSAQLPGSGSDLQRRLRPAAAAHDVRLERQRSAHDEVHERALHRDRPGAQRFALGGKNKGTHFGITGYQSTHNVGGAVMGSDPSTSVVNKYLQSWDVSNLFVVGGSAFPQNPANGPTETIGMLACWAADAIKDYVRNPDSLV